MMSRVQSAAVLGMSVLPIDVEVDISNGLPGLTIVGLPDKSVGESRERVRAAVRASGMRLPDQRITVNLAPADVKKEGPAFDLAIAIGLLTADDQVPEPPGLAVFLGELSLGGELNPVRGVLPVVAELAKRGLGPFFLPAANANEATLISGTTVFPANTLQEVVDHLKAERPLVQIRHRRPEVTRSVTVDLSEVRGQGAAKRALEIAAAGGHNLLLSGPPGTGKTLLAQTLAGILPTLSESESIEVTTVYSVAGLLGGQPLVQTRPFRNPHHSISLPGLIGGGPWPRPGELSLAHRGILYLDEIPQFPRHVLESLRGPLEDGKVRISRAQHTLEFPTACTVVASQNPCPCGYADDPDRDCRCSPMAVERYRQRLSGPLRDRFDLTVEVPRLPYGEIQGASAESSETVRDRVMAARRLQRQRLGGDRVNADLTGRELANHCRLPEAAAELLREAVDCWHLSVRGYHRVLKVARTIADLASGDEVTEAAVAEALQYRQTAEPQPA